MCTEFIHYGVQIGEKLWDPIKRQLSYLFHYRSNLELVKQQTEKLCIRKQDIQVAFNDARSNGYETKSEVENWLKSAEDEIQKMEIKFKEQEEDKEKEKCLIFSWCGSLCGRYKLSKQAVKDAAGLGELLAKGEFEHVSHQVRRPLRIESTMPVETDFGLFESTRKAMDEVEKALQNEDVGIVGVYGMGGVGKTTLMKKLGAHLHQRGLFNQVIMVVASQSPNIKKMQGQLADSLGMELREETEMGRAARLKERLARESKVLFVLDDLWTEMELSEIGIPSEDELKASQSKIVLTTRLASVCSLMGSHAQVPLHILSQDDSWILFRNAAGSTVVNSPKLNDVARKVAQECGGLPVALRSVAKALRRKDLKGWEEAARRLQTSKSSGLYHNNDKVFQCIKLSYDFLTHDDAKPLFMFCCLFPEDFDIDVELLVMYGIGRGLFRDADTILDARETARSVLDYLIDSNLLLESERKGHVKMHDVVRDMGIQIISSVEEYAALVRAGVGLEEWPRWKDDYEACTVISLMHNKIQEIPAGTGLACPLLQVLLMPEIGYIQEMPDEFFKDVNKSLGVLHLNCFPPSSLGHLTNLRALFLDYCELVDISMLGELKKLEILSLRGNTLLYNLPREIAQLASLRMLDLTECENIVSIPPNVILRLSSLEELYMTQSFDKWGLGSNASFEEVTCLRRLRILQVGILHPQFLPENVVFQPNYFKFYIRLGKVFDIYGRDLNHGLCQLDTTIKFLPSWLNNAVKAKVEALEYRNCSDLHDIVEEYDHHGELLNGLKSLVIENCHNTVHLMDFTTRASNKPVFTSLERLSVFSPSGLKRICVGQLPHGSLGELKFLKLFRCYGLIDVLLPSNLLKLLQNLQTLQVIQCDIKEVFGCGGPEGRLRSGSPHHLPIFHNLKFLTLWGCYALENVFTPDISQCFLQLEMLRIWDCKVLKEIIGKDEDEATTHGVQSLQEINVENNITFPQLSHLVLEELPDLTSIYSGHATVEFPLLEHLYVKYCPKFRFSITTSFYSNKTIIFNDEHHYRRLQKSGII